MFNWYKQEYGTANRVWTTYRTPGSRMRKSCMFGGRCCWDNNGGSSEEGSDRW